MHYLIISFSYKNSSLELREKLDLSNDDAHIACMKMLLAHPSIRESIVVNTCNRIEIVANVKELHQVQKDIFKMLNKRSNVSVDELQGRADIFTDEGAIHHLFSVASSLDSLVVGETQIVGQMRDALKFSLDHHFCGKRLLWAMNFAFKCAAKVRSSTHISSKPVSIASVAVAKAKEELEHLQDAKALVIGSGEMSRLACKHLLAHGCRVTLINRTKEKAWAIRDEVGDTVVVEDFDKLPFLINEHDLLFTATSSKEPIIKNYMIRPYPSKRYWFDLAVPRDIESVKNEWVKINVVDDLEDIAKQNIEFRQEEAKSSYAIIGHYTQAFYNWLQSMNVEPVIKGIYEKALQAAEEETTRVLSKGFISDEYAAQAHKLAQQAMKRFLHVMGKNLRAIAHTTQADEVMESLQLLFALEEEENTPVKEQP